MDRKLEKAYYQTVSLRAKIITALVYAVFYYLFRYLCQGPLVQVTAATIDPSLALNCVFGITMGWIGAISCTLGSIAHVLLTLPIDIVKYYIPGALANGIEALAVFLVWHYLSYGEERIYRLTNARRVFRATICIIVGAVVFGIFSNIILLVDNFDLSYFLYYAWQDFIDAADLGMIVGLPLLILLTCIVTKLLIKDYSKTVLSNTEKIILLFGCIELVVFILIVISQYAVQIRDPESIFLIFGSYKIAIFAENILLAIMLFICAHSTNKDSIVRAIAKVTIFLILVALIFNLYISINERILAVSTILTINVISNGCAMALCAVLLFACIMDTTKINKQSTIYIVLLMVISVGTCISTAYYTYGEIKGDDNVAAYFSGLEAIFNVVMYLLIWSYCNVTLGVNKKHIRRQTFLIVPSASLYLICNVLYQILNLTGQSLYSSIFLLVSALSWVTTLVMLIVDIIKHRRQAFETLSLLSIATLGTVFEIVAIFIPGLYMTYIGELVGVLLCFSSVYLQRSKLLGDTQKDLVLSASIQINMLPVDFKIEDFDTIDLFASMRPAKEVGGDFYDFFRIDRNHLMFIIADVSGKGTPGAMMMMRAITSVKNFALAGLGLEKIMEMASNNINEHNDAMLFVTAWMGKLNLETGELEFINAGHNPPIIRHDDGSVDEINSKPDLIMGFFPEAHYRSQTIYLKEGDTLYLYTDGVTEAYNELNEQYGMDRLKKAISAEYISSEELCTSIVKSVDLFAGATPQFDDMTMLAVKYIQANNHLINEYDATTAKISYTEDTSYQQYYENSENATKISFDEIENVDQIEIEII